MESYPLGEGHFNRTIYLFFEWLTTLAIYENAVKPSLPTKTQKPS